MSIFDKKRMRIELFPILILLVPFGFCVVWSAYNISSYAIFTIFIVFSCAHILLLLGVKHEKLFTKNINHYFFARKYPWSKYYLIGQRKGIKQPHTISCRQIIAIFNKQSEVALSKMKSGEIYLMYTHTTVIHHLRRVPKFLLTEFNDKTTLPLTLNFKELIGRDCAMCPNAGNCIFLKHAKRDTVFSTVRIEVK